MNYGKEDKKGYEIDNKPRESYNETPGVKIPCTMASCGVIEIV